MNENSSVDPALDPDHHDASAGSTGPGESGSPDTGEGGSGEGGAPSELEVLRHELESVNDRHLRLAAEFDNYRRRSQLQLGEASIRGQADLVGRLLEVVDDFARVSTLDPVVARADLVLEGIGMIETKLHAILRDAGLEVIDPAGEAFDPNTMEAMVRVPTDDPDQDDVVDQVFQRGFRFGGHLVRPARVSVRKHG